MAMTRQQIKSAALKLAPSEREALAEELLLSIADSERKAIDAEWLAEVHRRDEAFKRGKTGAKPVEMVIERLKSRGS
jgi:putative addiction module component (TIGR02574 family)